MFIDNKYTRVYYEIVNRAQARVLTIYGENHHIVPKSLGGGNAKSNLVKLTAREHFICHWLLTKMVSGQHDQWKMTNALGHMMWSNNKSQQRYKINSRLYESLKQKHSKMRSWAMTGERNSQYGRKWTEEQKQKVREKNTGNQINAEQRKKISDSKKGKSRDEETKRKISETKKLTKQNAGENNPMFGRKHSPETLEKIRQAARNRKPKADFS